MRLHEDVKPELRILLFEITQKCNAACEQCGSRCDASGEETLTKEEILGVLRDVKESFGTGVMLNVTGGEPTLRKDLFEIMGEAHRMGFDWGMVTNGTMLTDRTIEAMKQSGMKTVTVSIDGLKETHESLRKLPGSFDRILTGLRKLREADFLDCLQVTFTSNKKNYREFPELYRILSEIGVDSIRTSPIDPIGRASEHPELMLDREDLEFLISFANRMNRTGRVPIEWGCCHYLADRIERRKFLCFAGIYAASILYNGDIFVCPNVERRPELIQGNIRTDRFSDVWEHRFLPFRNRSYPEKCRQCLHFPDCLSDSFHTFDFDRNEPKCCYRDIFETDEKDYRESLKERFGRYRILSVDGEGPAPDVYLEPDAYRDIRSYFHFGEDHPLSAFEQQMGMVGFKGDSFFVIRYVFPSPVDSRAEDAAYFTKDTLSAAVRDTEIIRRNAPDLDGRRRDLRFLGFIHSHPSQPELQYSTGDEYLHRRLVKRFGDYFGMLVYPKGETLGVYYGPEIIQAHLKIIEPEDLS